MSIRAEHLFKSFEGRAVLSDVCMEIPDGEIVGFYGPSGIGKSTLARLLCGIQRPDRGSIYLDGALLASPSGYDRKAGIQIQMVYQQPYASLDGGQKLINGFRELIRYHHFADRSETQALIEKLMDSVGLSLSILGHLPHQISGGEAQRVAIARCLLFQPKLLILDEATSMLDVSTQANILSLIRKNAAGSGGSILLISHDKALVEHLCGKIYDINSLEVKERTHT